MLEQQPKLYAAVAFVAGILVCLAYKDIYPDLEQRYRRRYGARKSFRRFLSSSIHHIDLEDREKQSSPTTLLKIVPEGLESCVGNTPLFKIKSLSDATGCDVLAKAEVSSFHHFCCFSISLNVFGQFLNGCGGSPKDRVALSMINLVPASKIRWFNCAECCIGGRTGPSYPTFR